MATIKVNLVDQNTGQPLAPFFYNMVAGDSYIVAPYSNGGQESNEAVLRIQVKDSAGADKEYISIFRYEGSSDGTSMPECLQSGVQKSIQSAYELEPGSEEGTWNTLSGEAWNACVDAATSNGGEPGVFQEAIWYMNESDSDEFATSQSDWKTRKNDTATAISDAATKAQNAGFDSFRYDGIGIIPITGNLDPDALAAAVVGPNMDIPHLMKIGVTYQQATVTAGAIPNN